MQEGLFVSTLSVRQQEIQFICETFKLIWNEPALLTGEKFLSFLKLKENKKARGGRGGGRRKSITAQTRGNKLQDFSVYSEQKPNTNK